MPELIEENTINEILKDVFTASTVEQMLHGVWENLLGVFKPSSSALIEFHEGRYKVMMSRNLSNEYTKHLIDGSKNPVLEEVRRKKKPLIIRNGSEYFRKEGFRFEKDFSQLVAVPMFYGREIGGAGYMDFESGEPYTEDDVTFFSNIVSICGLRIYADKLKDIAERSSSYDPLTHVYSYKRFHEELFQEIKRADFERCNIILALIFLDRLKGHNDMYGHVSTDLAIKQIARHIQSGVRGIDITSRYGGAKFALIMPDIEMEEARESLEKIRRRVEKEFSHYQEESARLTLSIGLVSYPDQAENEKLLINKTEQLLYECKRKNGNIVLAEEK